MPKARVVRDDTYPGMWRVMWPDGTLSDLGNISRVHDAAARFNETLERNQRGRQRREQAARSDLNPSKGMNYRPTATALTQNSTAAL